MVIIGEKLNSSVPAAQKAFASKDTDALCAMVDAQVNAGAHYLDVNTALLGDDELSAMLWAVSVIAGRCGCGIMLDSPNPAVITAASERLENRKIIFNSVTLDERFDELVPYAAERGCGVVGLPIDGGGIPADAGQKTRNALRLAKNLAKAGIPEENIYIDVLAGSLAADCASALSTLETIRNLREENPRIHIICGLSNISFGLPQRTALNNAFLCAALAAGLSSAILDITAPSTRMALHAAQAVLGRDEYCLNYINISREK